MRHNTDGQDPTVTRHLGATRIGLASIPQCQKHALVFFLFKKFERPQQLCAKDYGSSRGCSALQDRQTQKERVVGRDLCLDLAKNLFIHRGLSYLHKSKRIMV
jgi:hypothetical protein